MPEVADFLTTWNLKQYIELFQGKFNNNIINEF